MPAIGIDTHKRTLAACAVDDVGGVIDERTFDCEPAGFVELAAWAGGVAPEIRFGIEGSASYGAPAAHHLNAAGFVIREVPPIYRLVAPKTDRSRRTIQLPEFASAALQHQRRTQVEARLAAGGRWLENDLVFAGPMGGPLPPGSVTRRFEALVARSGLGRLRFHDLRHAAATVMLAQGVEPRVISEMLGHSSLGMTADVYAGVVPALGRAAAARMDEALSSTR